MERSTQFSLLGSKNRISKVLNPGIDFSLTMKILDVIFFKNDDDWLKNLFVDGKLVSCVNTKFRVTKKETSVECLNMAKLDS